MATRFSRDDVKTCFHCDKNSPAYRLISLERCVNESHELEPDSMVGLFCEHCLKLEINDILGTLSQNKIPVGRNESASAFLSRQIGFLVVPLALTNGESEILMKEIQSDWRKEIIN